MPLLVAMASKLQKNAANLNAFSVELHSQKTLELQW